MALTDKQEMFCREYLIDLNATQAAIRAGYSTKTANLTASENLSKPDIQLRISELKLQRNDLVGINATYVLNRLVKRYRCSHGGRGSAKTRTFAMMTAVKAYQAMMNGEAGVILCASEFMNSLEESSMQEVKQAILSVPWLAANFDIGEKHIRTIDKSVNYVFCGLRHNLDSIKSKARILLCWGDEAESVSEIACQKLSPTVREEGSEIWVTWNPERDGSSTDKRFRKEAGDDCITVEMNYTDTPWFPDVLEGERLNDERRLDPAACA